MRTPIIQTVALLVGVGMLIGCSPAWILDGLDAVDLPIIDTLAGRDFPRFDTSHTNTPPRISSIKPSLEVESGEAVFLGPNSLYAVIDAEDGLPRLSIVSDVDGPLPPQDFSFPSLDPRVLTITAIDAQGANAHATLTINVLPTSSDHSGFTQACAQTQVASRPQTPTR